MRDKNAANRGDENDPQLLNVLLFSVSNKFLEAMEELRQGAKSQCSVAPVRYASVLFRALRRSV